MRLKEKFAKFVLSTEQSKEVKGGRFEKEIINPLCIVVDGVYYTVTPEYCVNTLDCVRCIS